mgnify:CR=1 FL=1|jgi:subtilisin
MRLESAITRPGSRFVTAIALMSLAACGVDSPTSAPDVSGDPQFARGGQNLAPFIVVLHENARDVRGLANKLVGPHGRQPDLIYEHAIKGFAVWLPAQAARGLANHPSVAYVEEDREVSIAAQSVPTGIDRIFASSNTNIHINGSDDFRVDVDVAIIDTGIDWEHPDLNVVDGINCARRKGCNGNGDDDHYHGTHVAGTVAALDNDVGVVGVAPGARLHAVKVLDRRGSGYASWIVAGIDWVAARADVIEVANMSLGGSGYSNAEYQAIQNAVDLGVAFAVAAGNSAADSDGYSPAAFDNVLTVSALADFNGQPGGGAASTCRSDTDDTFASFSNFGAAVDIIAPGVCIESTYPLEEGGYGTISGTSMASPHAAGGLALLASSNRATDAAGVEALYSALTSAGNYDWDNNDDGDSTQEPLLDVSTFSPALIVVGGGNLPPTATIESSCVGASCTFDGSGSTDDGSVASYAWDFGDGGSSTATSPAHTYLTWGTYTVTLTVTDNQGATGQASTDVVITDTNNAAPTATIQSATCNGGATCDFVGSGTDTDGNVASYAWDFGDGGSSTATNPTHTYTASGTYTVTLTVTDDQGATGQASTDVLVEVVVSSVSFTYTAGKAGKGRNAVRIDTFSGGSGVSGLLRVTRSGNEVISVDPFETGIVYLLNNEKGGKTYQMTVCDNAGVCAATVTVQF